MPDPRWLEHLVLVLNYRWVLHLWPVSPWKDLEVWYSERMGKKVD